MISPDKIAREEFDEALGRYPALLHGISISKTPAKEGQGQLTLEQLDKYRFEEAPTRYYNKEALEDPDAAPTPLSHPDVVQLVKWKLKHGTFRPNLLKLAESNSPDDIKTASLDAFTTYKKNSFDATAAITKLTSLRGIGPATASLLLSVHDAARVPFFSDELYQWICHDGQKVAIKYNMKEYEDVVAKTRALIERMNVEARDVEKVAFVLVKEAASGVDDDTNNNSSKEPDATATNGTTTAETSAPATAAKKPRRSEPKPPREPTDMTEERKAQLVEIAERARKARVAKRAAHEAARLAKGRKFRERIDAARERKRNELGSPSPSLSPPPLDADTGAGAGAGRKREREVTTRGSAAAAKRSKK